MDLAQAARELIDLLDEAFAVPSGALPNPAYAALQRVRSSTELAALIQLLH